MPVNGKFYHGLTDWQNTVVWLGLIVMPLLPWMRPVGVIQPLDGWFNMYAGNVGSFVIWLVGQLKIMTRTQNLPSYTNL